MKRRLCAMPACDGDGLIDDADGRRCGAARENGHFPECELGAVLEPIR